jgi:hypothetical protein
MLHDDEARRQIFGKRGQDKAERFEPARGSGDRDDVETIAARSG